MGVLYWNGNSDTELRTRVTRPFLMLKLNYPYELNIQYICHYRREANSSKLHAKMDSWFSSDAKEWADTHTHTQSNVSRNEQIEQMKNFPQLQGPWVINHQIPKPIMIYNVKSWHVKITSLKVELHPRSFVTPDGGYGPSTIQTPSLESTHYFRQSNTHFCTTGCS